MLLHVERAKGSLEQRRVNHVDINGGAQTSNDGGGIACLSSLMSSQMIALVTGWVHLASEGFRFDKDHTR